jgi:hypothetical protein
MDVIDQKTHNIGSAKSLKRKRTDKLRKSDDELVRAFWLAPVEAYFDQLTVAPVTGSTPKTLECDRWKKSGIPFRKVGGKVLYQKRHVIDWLEGHELVTSTSQYKQEVCHED